MKVHPVLLPQSPSTISYAFSVSMVQIASVLSFANQRVAFISFSEKFNFTSFSIKNFFLSGSLQMYSLNFLCSGEKKKGKALGELSFLQLINFFWVSWAKSSL